MKTQNVRNARRESGWFSVPLVGAFFTRIVPHVFALYRETKYFLSPPKIEYRAGAPKEQWPYPMPTTLVDRILSGCDKLSSFRFNPFMSVTFRLALVSLLLCTAISRAEDPLPHLSRLQSSPVLRHLKKNDLG